MSKENVGGLKSISQGRSDIHRVDPRILNIKDNWNCRDINSLENKDHIEMLVLSITEIGVQEPLTVYWENEKAYVSDGHCRLVATMKAIANGVDIKTIPVKSELRYSNDADKLFSQIIRNSGKPFSQMERAKVFKRLLDMGWQQTDIAAKSGVTPSLVSQCLDLLTMPEPIKAMVSSGQISASMAKATLKDHGPATAVTVLQDAIAVAASEGSVKAMPKHVQPQILNTAPVQWPTEPVPTVKDWSTPPANAVTKPTPTVRGDIVKVVKNAFEFADVDDEGDIVIIKMPMEQWEAIRRACEL